MDGGVHGGISLDAIRCAAARPGGVDAIGVPNGRGIRLLQSPLAGDPHPAAALAPADSTERIARLGRRASFVPPEMMLSGRPADRRGDVYSLGCVFHALLTGRPPCWQGDAQRTLSQAAIVGPEALGPPRVPVEIATLVSYMVSRDPAGRYPDAAEAADAIAACLGLPPVSATLPPQQTLSPHEPPADARVTTGPGVATPPPAPAERLPDIAAVRPTVAASAARSRGHRRRLLATAAGGGIVAALLAVGLMTVLSRGPARDRRQAETKVARQPAEATTDEPAALADATTPAPPAAEEASPVGNAAPRYTVVESADLPWAAPTSGRPPALSYLPPGSQLVLLARPADLLATDEGGLFVRALGPRVAAGIDALAGLCGAGLEAVEEILGGWQAGEPGAGQEEVVGAWVVRLAEPTDLATDREARTQAWGETMEEEIGDEVLHHGEALSFWLPTAEEGRVLAIAPAALLRQMAEAGGPPRDGTGAGDPPLPAGLSPDMESLVGMLDRTSHVVVLGSPHYLLHDGRPLLGGGLARLIDPIHEFFGDDVKAAAVSLHFGDNFYLELDAIPSRDEPAKSLARRLAAGVDSWGDAAVDAIAATTPHEYGRKLVIQLPAMIRVLAANTRAGPEGRAAVLNAYLPRHAAHNLALASELALEQPPAGLAASDPQSTQRGRAAAAGALEKLQQKMTLTFPRETLEKSVQLVADEIGVPIEILGRDLEVYGIMKNQSFGLEERDKTAEAVLRAILTKSDPSGRLLFVVRTKDGQESLGVTTRDAAVRRGEPLPPGFEPLKADETAKGKTGE